MAQFRCTLALLACLLVLSCVPWTKASPTPCGGTSEAPCVGRDNPEIDVNIVVNEQRKLGIQPAHHLNVTTELATFGMGCFWGAESLWGSIKGVVSTTVGYSSGTKDSPTYKNYMPYIICNSSGDHTEVVEVYFDPKVISYAELLKIFWDNSHSITINVRRQYRSLIQYGNEQQKKIAEESKDVISKRHAPTKIYTAVEPKTKFYVAENYHQKYSLQSSHTRLVQSLGLDHDLMKTSYVATVLNSHLSGHGTMDGLYAIIDKLGLTPSQKAYVISASADMVGKGTCGVPEHAQHE